MAFYDNKHWLLSHIRNSFMSSDDTGMCEMVMLGEDIPKKFSNQLSKFDCYPDVDESDEDGGELDMMGQSYDIQSDIDFGAHRHRTNTAQRLEKMDVDRRKAACVQHVKWEWNPMVLSDKERANLFGRKDFKQNKEKELSTRGKHSLLADQLEKCPLLPRNPFLDYAKYDGSAQVGVSIRKYGIFLTMLPENRRNYPMHVSVLSAAKVQDLIGLICLKYSMENEDYEWKDGVEHYGLYIAEDDGEVDRDFPCLDSRENVGKFGFGFLALVEREEIEERNASKLDETFPIFEDLPNSNMQEIGLKHKAQLQAVEDLKLMKGHLTAMEAPLYQSYRVYIINKMRAKAEIHLGISGEKVEIDPVVQQKVSAKFWSRQKAVSYDMDNVAACDLTDTKSSSRVTLRLVYHSASDTPGFKHHDFEADLNTAEEIVQKINNILELRSSMRRKEYLALRERKSHRRRSFHLGPR